METLSKLISCYNVIDIFTIFNSFRCQKQQIMFNMELKCQSSDFILVILVAHLSHNCIIKIYEPPLPALMSHITFHFGSIIFLLQICKKVWSKQFFPCTLLNVTFLDTLKFLYLSLTNHLWRIFVATLACSDEVSLLPSETPGRGLIVVNIAIQPSHSLGNNAT